MSHSQAVSNLTERLAERLDGRDNSNHACKLLNLVEKMDRQVTALDNVRSARNPLDTDATHSRRVAKAAQKLYAASQMIYGQINDVSSQGFGEVEKLINEQSGLVQGDYSAEIRAAFRGMTDKERTATLKTALDEGNSEVVAAVCLSPSILSGVKKEVQARYVDNLRQQKAPELIQEYEDIVEAFHVAGVVLTTAQKMYDESYNLAEQGAIDKAESEASVAELMLQTSIEG
jgi:hypothetical protein